MEDNAGTGMHYLSEDGPASRMTPLRKLRSPDRRAHGPGHCALLQGSVFFLPRTLGRDELFRCHGSDSLEHVQLLHSGGVALQRVLGAGFPQLIG